jgi:hypothetical protein
MPAPGRTRPAAYYSVPLAPPWLALKQAAERRGAFMIDECQHLLLLSLPCTCTSTNK